MNVEDGPRLIWGIIMIIMVASSLAARRLPLKDTMKMLLAWIAIFAALFAVFSFRFELLTIWDRVKADFGGTANQSAVGEAMHIRRGDNGHFNVRVEVNGNPVDFMIDSGATTTALSNDAAKAAKVDVDTNGFSVAIDTANGTVMAKRGVIGSFQLGTIKLQDLNVTVSDNLGDTNLLGMNFLDRLRSWKVEGDVMTLDP